MGARFTLVRSPAAHRAAWLAIFIVAGFLIRCSYYHPYFGTDDSNIFQVYGSHLAHGDGWRYVAGGERVEGTTSFLYTLLWAGAFRTPYPLALMHLFNLSCCFVACWSALRCIDYLRRDVQATVGVDWPVFGYLLWLALIAGILTWTTITLMDASLWTAVLLVCVMFLCRLAHDQDTRGYSWRMSIVGSLAAITRPESLVLIPGLLALAVIIVWQSNPGVGKSLRVIAIPAAVFTAAAAGLTLFRCIYFGYPAPNTYYAKVSPDLFYNLYGGARYLARSAIEAPLIAPMAVAFLWLIARAMLVNRADEPEQRNAAAAVLASVLMFVAIPVLNGGDHFKQGRMLVPALMLLPTPILAGLGWRSKPLGRAPLVLAVPAIFLTIVLAFFQVGWSEHRGQVRIEFTIATSGLTLGELLNAAFDDPKPSVGVITAGGIARSYQGAVVDLLGLNNTLVAHASRNRVGVKNHASFSREAFYQLQPDLVHPVLFDTTKSARNIDVSVAFIEAVSQRVFYDRAFQDLYALVELRPRRIRREMGVLGDAARSALGSFITPRPREYAGLRVYIKRTLVGRLRGDVFLLNPSPRSVAR